MKTLKKQAGLSMWSWMIVLGMFGTLVFQATNLVGPYSNYFLMDKIMDDLPSFKSKREAGDYVAKRAGSENVDQFDQKEDLIFKTTRNGFSMEVVYEQRVNLIKSLDFVVVYNRKVEIRKSSF